MTGVLWRYALRNVWRHPERSLLTGLAVVVAVGMVIAGQTMLTGLKAHVITELARQTGHVRLRDADFAREARFDPLGHLVPDVAALGERLRAVPGVTDVQPRLTLQVLVQATDTSTIVPESAGVPEDQLTDEQIFGRKTVEFAPVVATPTEQARRHQGLDARVVAGRYFSAPDAPEILIGVELARRLKVKPGDAVEVLTNHHGLRDIGATVVGVVDSGNRFANRTCHMPLALAAQLLDLPDRATEVLVFGADLEGADALKAAVRATGLGETHEVLAWREIGVARLVSVVFDFVLSILLGMIIAVAAIGLLNTMLMAVLERQREVGVLMALGVARGHIVRLFLLEALVFGVLGAVVGVLAGLGGSLWLVEHGVKLGGASRRMIVAVSDTIHGVLTPGAVALGLVVGLLVAIGGAWWPAWKASRVHPVEAMRRQT